MQNRPSIRLKEYDYSLTGAYFVTICVQERKSLLGAIEDNSVALSQIGKFVYLGLEQISDSFESVELDEFIIMPNHIHAIIMINNDDVETMEDRSKTVATEFIASNIKDNPMQTKPATLGKIIRFFKVQTTHTIRNECNFSNFQWQANYYDHIVRNENELNRIREYIMNNPVKWPHDLENPDHIPCNNDENLKQIEGILHGKKT